MTLRKRTEQYADSGHGACYLRDERIARLVQDALKYFDGERYRLLAWCVMPNHVHVLIEVTEHSLSDIVHSWKSFTAHRANKLLARTGRFWMPDYFDRFMRDDRHFAATVDYIRQNPVKAGLVDAPEKWPWSGWVESGRDAREPRIAFLKTHPTLVLDTRHFDPDPSTGSGQGFVDRLLASFDDLDGMTNGLLVHSENWQALNLLGEKYRERVKCIYIDPPYNTGNDEFIYKDNYQHSSWLTMISQVATSARNLMSTGSVFFASCDDNESYRFREYLDNLFGTRNFESQIIIQSNKRGQTYKSIAKTHEYLLVYDGDEDSRLNGLPRDVEPGEEDEYGRFELWELRNRNPKFGRFNRPNLYFPIYVSEKQYQKLGYSCVAAVPTKDFSVAVS